MKRQLLLRLGVNYNLENRMYMDIGQYTTQNLGLGVWGYGLGTPDGIENGK